MKLSLRLKLILAAFLAAAAGFAYISLPGSRLLQKREETKTSERLYQAANYLAASYQVNKGSVNQSELEGIAFALNADIWILDLEGNIKAHSGNLKPSIVFVPFTPVDGKKGYYMTGDFYRTFDRETLSVYAPLTSGVTAHGYVVLHYPVSLIRSSADSQLATSYIMYGIMVLFIILLLVLVDILILRRITKLKKAASEFANGNLSYPVNIKGNDDISDTALMVEDLARQLNSSSEDQHRFLANISHDFRSPLTSIKGYMTAIQDGVIPPDMQGKYIDVVINEADRLTALANDLIDITHLENGIILHRSDFDINEMIREILPTFEGPVRDKHLVFNVIFEEESRYVYADGERIQQVIYNLVDNAIKFSSPDSSIDVSTTLHQDKVFVSVKDHGIGIEKDELNKIWERFYKSDASRGKDKSGTGLGLSIVREIVQAHKENIDVISTPGVGTEFVFTLPAA